MKRVRDYVFNELSTATPSNPPLLVHTMGKVGSRSVNESIRNAAIARPLHVHHVAAETRERVRWRVRKLGYRQPPYRFVGLAIREYLDQNTIDFPWKIITLVRDPVARALSGFHHAHELLGRAETDGLGRLKPAETVRQLEARFRHDTAFNYHNSWFDIEIKGVFDLDVFASPFDKESGVTRYRSDKADVLLLTLERLSETFGPAVESFLEVEQPVPLIRVNDRLNTVGGVEYKRVVRHFRLPESVLRRIYASPTVTHFYTDETVESWIRHWSRLPESEPINPW